MSSSLSISSKTSTIKEDGSIPSTSRSNTAQSSYASSSASNPNRSYTSPSRRSPTTSIRSAANASSIIGMRNNSLSNNRSAIEDEIGNNKSGIIVGLMGFTKSSKKTYYAILSDRCFELHDTLKSYKKKKSARHIFDLATCFNINRHDDAKLKTCVSIMTPDDTFIFRAADEDKLRDANDRATMEWYEAMMVALVNARALHLGRPVMPAEFFEYCWDVTLVSKPKIKKPVPNPEKFENICLLKPELKTRHRLGFYANTIVLCKMGIQPAIHGLPKSGIPPFRIDHFIEIPRQYVASFGFQEKYFIMRIGRAAPIGMCEIWAQCESDEVAASIHTRLNEIIEREGKKRKSQSSSSTIHHHHHHTPSITPVTTGASSASSSSKDIPSSSISEPSHSPKIDHHLTTTPESATHYHHQVPPPTIPLKSSSQRPRIHEGTYFKEDNSSNTLPAPSPANAGCYRPLGAKSIDQAILRDITRHETQSAEDQPPRSLTVGSQSPSSSTWLNMLRRSNNRGDNQATSTSSTYNKFSPTITSTLASSQQHQRRIAKPTSFYPVVEWAKQRTSLVSGNSQPDDETEDSGGTLKVTDYEDQILEKPNVLMNGSLPHEKLIELALQGRLNYGELGSRGSTSSYDDEFEDGRRKRSTLVEADRKKPKEVEAVVTKTSGGEDYPRLTPEEQEDSSSFTADDAYSDDLSSERNCKHENCEGCSTSSLSASSHTSGHHEKESNSSGSVSHLLVPSTTEQQHLEDIQSYISDSSDSCYSSLNANVYPQNPPRAFSFSNNLLQTNINDVPTTTARTGSGPGVASGSGGGGVYEMMHPMKYNNNTSSRINEHKIISNMEESLPLSNEGLQLGEEAATSATMPKSIVRIQGCGIIPANMLLQPKEDLRKRAFSLGSKSWILKPLRKLSNTQAARASSSKASSIADESENECNESVASHRSHPESTSSRQPSMAHIRSDSIDSAASQPSGGGKVITPRFVKNSNISKKPNDLMEVNFSPPNNNNSSITNQYNSFGGSIKGAGGSSNSVDSNSQRSRAPSFISHKATDSCASEADEEAPQVPQEVQMHEVKCFIKNDDDFIYGLLKERDTTSLISTKTESSMPYFETIEEHVSSPPSPRSNSQLSRKSLEPKSPPEIGTLKGKRKESGGSARLQPPILNPADQVTYVLIGNQPDKFSERKASVPSPRIRKDQPQHVTTRKSLSQSKSDNLKTPNPSS